MASLTATPVAETEVDKGHSPFAVRSSRPRTHPALGQQRPETLRDRVAEFEGLLLPFDGGLLDLGQTE